MQMTFKNEPEAKKYFLRACHTKQPGEIILFHDQRETVAKVLKEVSAECGRILIDKDLTTLKHGELGCMKKPGAAPCWLEDVMNSKNPGGYILYLREFHLTGTGIQDEVMNILIRKEIEGYKFPDNTLVVLGVRKEDEAAEALSHTHVAKFYK
jgi:hypothetical protein